MLVFSIVCDKCGNKNETIFILLKVLGLINNMEQYQMNVNLLKKWVKKSQVKNLD